MITENLFVEHATNKELGLGKIVGSFPTMVQTSQGNAPILLAAVTWENSPQPAFQLYNPDDLINVTDLFEEDDEEEGLEVQEALPLEEEVTEGEVQEGV